MKIAVIDDERPSRKELIHQILSVMPDSLIEEADSGSNALELISSRPWAVPSWTNSPPSWNAAVRILTV